MPQLSFLYISACLRHSSLMYYIWLGNGLSPLTYGALLHGQSISQHSGDSETTRPSYSSTPAGVSRSDVSETLTQAHGPWILHLGSRERIEALRRLAKLYSGLRYRRKEAYILRELLACVMDLVVQGREEARGSDLTLGMLDTSQSASGTGSVGVREKDDVVGNASILRLVRYICEVHGVDLDSVKFAAEGSDISQQSNAELSEVEKSKQVHQKRPMIKYTWPDLQVGMIRESLAVAEALPGKPALHTVGSKAHPL